MKERKMYKGTKREELGSDDLAWLSDEEAATPLKFNVFTIYSWTET